MIRFSCPSCGMAFSAPEDCAGRSTKCRGCNHPIIVPNPLPQSKPPEPRDKTALGRVISHTPTAVKPPEASGLPAAPRKNPTIKAKKTAKPVNISRPASEESPKRSIEARLGIFAGGIVLVFAASGLFGLGVYRYLDSSKSDSDGKGNNTVAQAPVQAEEDRLLPVRYANPPEATRGEQSPPAQNAAFPSNSQKAPPSTPRVEARPAEASASPPAPLADSALRPQPILRPRTELTPRPRPTPAPERRSQEKDEPPPPKATTPPARPAPSTLPAPVAARREEPTPSKKEEPVIDARLKPLLDNLRSKKARERLQALADLASMKEEARPAARAICGLLIADLNPAVRQAALEALEKIYPELHFAVLVLIVEKDWNKNIKAARDIAALEEQGSAAIPVLLHHLNTALTRFSNPRLPLAKQGLEVMIADAQALAQIAPDDDLVQKTLIDLTRFTFTPPLSRAEIGGSVREAAVRVLGELLSKNPEQAKNVVPGLIAAVRGMIEDRIQLASQERKRGGPASRGSAPSVPTTTWDSVRGKLIALLGKIAEDNASLRPRIAAGLIDLANVGETAAIAQLGKCGRDAKDALPILKKFKLHPTETVRNAANQAIAQIEEALASAAQPSRTDVPQPKREPKQRREEANLPRELQPHVAQLKSGNTEERIKACMALEDLGEKAQPATRALCDAALSTSQKLSRAALKALEKVNPEIQKPVFILLVDEKAINHKDALRKLSALGEQGKPAMPVVLHEIKRCQELFNDPRARWGLGTLVEVTNDSMKTLPKIAADDPKALKTIIELTKFAFPSAILLSTNEGLVNTKAPFRSDGLKLLGKVAEEQLDFRKQIIPPVVAILKEAVQVTSSTNEFEVLAGIAEVDRAGDTLLKCGDEAKQTLAKEVLPRLKDLQFHKSENVRKTAEKLRKKIEDAP